MMMMMVVVMVVMVSVVTAISGLRSRLFSWSVLRWRRLRRGGDGGKGDDRGEKHSNQNFIHHFFLLWKGPSLSQINKLP